MTDVQPHQPLRPQAWAAATAGAPLVAPRLALSTTWGIGRLADLGDLVDEARQLGVNRLALGPRCRAEHVEQVIARLADDVRLSALTNVCPWPTDDAGDLAPLPSLAEPDPIAREIIVRWTEESIRLASYWGVPIVVARLDDAPQPPALTDAAPAGLRDAVPNAALTALLQSMDDLLPLCEEAGVELALVTPASPRATPSFDDLAELLARFRDAPLGYWHDSGRAHALELAGHRPARDWLTTFARRLVGASLHDHDGATDGLPPGAGQVDFASILAQATPTAPCVVELSSAQSAVGAAAGLAHLRAILPGL